jgi:subtilisin-like proprotein convertase family protein
VVNSSDFKIILFNKSCHLIPDSDKLEIPFSPPFIGNNLKIKNVRLRLSLYHDYLPDLVVSLLHKDRKIPLLNSPFPPYDDCCGSINEWFETMAFNGIDVYGEWKIIIEDTAPGDTGELYCAELELTVSSDTKDVAVDSSPAITQFRAGKKFKKQ